MFLYSEFINFYSKLMSIFDISISYENQKQIKTMHSKINDEN